MVDSFTHTPPLTPHIIKLIGFASISRMVPREVKKPEIRKKPENSHAWLRACWPAHSHAQVQFVVLGGTVSHLLSVMEGLTTFFTSSGYIHDQRSLNRHKCVTDTSTPVLSRTLVLMGCRLGKHACLSHCEKMSLITHHSHTKMFMSIYVRSHFHITNIKGASKKFHYRKCPLFRNRIL